MIGVPGLRRSFEPRATGLDAGMRLIIKPWMGLFAPQPGQSSTHLALLHVIGMLSALVFAFNFCLEALILFSLGRNHQILILIFQIILSGWALIEALLLRARESALPMVRLLWLLGLQVLVEACRLALVFVGPEPDIDRGYSLGASDLGSLGILFAVFFSVSQRSCLPPIAVNFSERTTRLLRWRSLRSG